MLVRKEAGTRRGWEGDALLTVAWNDTRDLGTFNVISREYRSLAKLWPCSEWNVPPLCQSIERPSIECRRFNVAIAPCGPGLAFVVLPSAVHTRLTDADFGSQFLLESQFFILVKLGRLEQASDPHGTLALCISGALLGLFAFLGVQLGVVAAKLLELDEEVAEMELESRQILVHIEEPIDERSDLRPATTTSVFRARKATGSSANVRLQVRKGVLEEIADEFLEESLVAGPCRRLVRRVYRPPNLARLDVVEHPGQQHRLRLEP